MAVGVPLVDCGARLRCEWRVLVRAVSYGGTAFLLHTRGPAPRGVNVCIARALARGLKQKNGPSPKSLLTKKIRDHLADQSCWIR
jgi:hypothetical protein